MAKISNYRSVPASEVRSIPKDAKWIEDALDPRDDALGEHTEALQGRLSFGDNINAEVRKVSLHHRTEVQISLQTLKGGSPIGVVCLWNSLNDYTRWTWRQIDVDVIGVTVDFSTTPTAEVDVTLLIIGS